VTNDEITAAGAGPRTTFAGGCLAAVVLLAAGCGGKTQPSDAAVDHPGANCGGTVDVSGTSPEGPFTATSVYAEVAINSSTCIQGLEFLVGDAATGSGFLFALRVDSVDGGAPVQLGKTSATVAFSGRSDNDAGLFQATTSAIVDVTAADPPPFATCEQALGDPIKLGTGNVAMTIMMTQDGFAMTGTLSTPFCSCHACPDTI
jgi:hypothetical protein